MVTGKRKSILLGGFLLLGGIAATTTGTAVRAAEAKKARIIEEILVTATRREESLQDVPVAVSVFSADQLERYNIDSAMDLSGKVPNLLVTTASGGTSSSLTFSIRGLSQNELTHVADPSVGVYINDIIVPRTHGANAALFDIQSVQVLRGPQGTLFGRNTTGGAVVITTARPVDETMGAITVGAASYDTYDFEGFANTRMADFANVRIAGSYKESDGYIKDVAKNNDTVNTKDEQGVRLSVDINPTDKWNSLFIASYTDIDDGGSGDKNLTGIGANPSLGQLKTASGIKQFSKIEIWSIDNQTTIDIAPGLTLKNIIGYRDLKMQDLEDLDGTAISLLSLDRHTTQDQISEELQLQGEQPWGDWILGGYYFTEDGNEQGYGYGAFSRCPGPEDPTSTNFRNYSCYNLNQNLVTNASYAVFGEVSYKLGTLSDALSAFTLTAGIRYNWDDRELDIRNRNLSAAGIGCNFTIDDDGDPNTPEVLPAGEDCRLVLHANYSEPTYNLSLEYQATDDVLLYIAHRHGYRTGGFGGRGVTEFNITRTFDPETVDDLEIGAKTVWSVGEGFLTTNVALFYNEYDDIQRILTDPDARPISTVPVNAAKAEIQGVELEVSYSHDMFELSGFYSYTDAKFKDYVAPTGEDLSDEHFARAPKNIYGVTARVFLPVRDSLGKVSFGTSFSHIDKFRPTDNPTGIDERGERDLLSFTLDWEEINGSNVSASLYVENATDDDYYSPSLPITPTTLDSQYAGAPRIIGGRVKVRFGG